MIPVLSSKVKADLWALVALTLYAATWAILLTETSAWKAQQDDSKHYATMHIDCGKTRIPRGIFKDIEHEVPEHFTTLKSISEQSIKA